MAPGEQKKHTQRLELEQNNQKNRPPITLNQKTPGFSAACLAPAFLLCRRVAHSSPVLA
jgi:hypothetical protein